MLKAKVYLTSTSGGRASTKQGGRASSNVWDLHSLRDSNVSNWKITVFKRNDMSCLHILGMDGIEIYIVPHDLYEFELTVVLICKAYMLCL